MIQPPFIWLILIFIPKDYIVDNIMYVMIHTIYNRIKWNAGVVHGFSPATKTTTVGKVSQENYEFRPLRNVCTKTLTCDLRLPVVLQTISRVQWNLYQINNCLFKQLVIRSTFQCVHAPQSLVFDLFLDTKKYSFFPSSCGRLCPKLPRFCVGPCCQDVVTWPCLVILDMGGITWLKWCTVVHISYHYFSFRHLRQHFFMPCRKDTKASIRNEDV